RFKVFQSHPVELVVYKYADRIVTFSQMNCLRPQVDIVISEPVIPVKLGVCRRCLGKTLAVVGSRAKDGYLHVLRLSLSPSYSSTFRRTAGRSMFWHTSRRSLQRIALKVTVDLVHAQPLC